jgi:hypothetical protein
MMNYFLQVELIVDVKNATAFEENVKKFLDRGAFRFFGDEFGIDLAMALKTPAAFQYSGYERYQSVKGQFEAQDRRHPLEAFRYIHLWQLNALSELDIARVMSRCADDLLYTKIDELVARESQELVSRVQWLAGVPDMTTGKRFIRVMRQFISRDLGTYLFKVGALFPLLEQKGFLTLGHFQNVTGPLNTVTEFWQTAHDDHKLESMNAALSSTDAAFKKYLVDGLDQLFQAEIRESFSRAPYFTPAASGTPGKSSVTSAGTK